MSRARSFWLPPFLMSQFETTLPPSRGAPPEPPWADSSLSCPQSNVASDPGLPGCSTSDFFAQASCASSSGSSGTCFADGFPSGTGSSSSFGQGEEATEFPVKGVSTGMSESLLPLSACSRAAQICLCCSSSSSRVSVSSSVGAGAVLVCGESPGASGWAPLGSGGVKVGEVPRGSGGVPGGKGG